VCDGLPRALAKLGHRVMTIAPRYDQYYDAWDTEFEAEVPMGEKTTTVRYFHAFKKGVDRVFVDHPLFLEKVWGLSKQKLYGPKWGKDYEDNQLRFAMFSKVFPLNPTTPPRTSRALGVASPTPSTLNPQPSTPTLLQT